MPIEWTQINSVISVFAPLIGVWLGARLTWKREEARESARNTKEIEYIAILVGAHLDRFATSCLHVALDDGTEDGRPAGTNGCNAPTVSSPTIDPLELDVNWKELPVALMYDILNIPNTIDDLEHQIMEVYEKDGPPDYWDFFAARQHGYAVLGLEVSGLAQRLRKHAALPVPPAIQGTWIRDDQLREQMRKMDRQKKNLPISRRL
jgi:hypothetical protein